MGYRRQIAGVDHALLEQLTFFFRTQALFSKTQTHTIARKRWHGARSRTGQKLKTQERKVDLDARSITWIPLLHRRAMHIMSHIMPYMFCHCMWAAATLGCSNICFVRWQLWSEQSAHQHTGVARIFCLGGGGTRPTPPSLASVVHTFEAVAGSRGSVSAPSVSIVIGGTPERNKNSNKI